MKVFTRKRIALFAVAVVVLSAAVLCSVRPQIALANSAAYSWDGSVNQGVYPADENCPLEVESEVLTFNIVDNPDYSDDMSSVTAEYNFYNPTEGDITARLMFPFGSIPDYYRYYGDAYNVDAEKYTVTLDGENANAELRFSYYSYSEFDYEVASAYLYDYKKADGYFSEDTVLTAVTFTVPEFADIAQTENLKDPYTYVTYTYDSNIKIITTDAWYFNDENQEGKVTVRYEGTGDFTVYFAGGVPQDITAYAVPWQENTNGKGYNLDYDSQKDAAYAVGGNTTFGEYIQSFNPFTGKYAESDWYNFSLDYITPYSIYKNYGVIQYFTEYDLEDIDEIIMYWYDYDIAVPAGGYVKNSVTAPIYPGMNTRYEPTLYDYTYYLSPAATWADFGSLTVIINTSGYILDSSMEFTQSGSAEEGFTYTAVYDGLPEGELTFQMCLSENPEKSSGGYSVIIIYLIVIAVCVALVVAAVVVLIVSLFKRRKNKRINKLW
ncbi:MAG: hypothetical protein LUI60_07855 [Clostridia bacterium]|nr:hypothetical protein [Clostridia bacterium]